MDPALVMGLGLSLLAGAQSGSEDAAQRTLELEGRLVAAECSPLALWPQRYRGELLVLEAVPHGAFVNEGDVLLRVDTRAIDEKIREAEFDVHEAEHKLAAAESEAGIEAEAVEAQLLRARREADWAARRLEGYVETKHGLDLEEIRLREQRDDHRIEDQRDELEQLEKMYREDELVDATEEIVLKRARRNLASTIAWAALREKQNAYTQEVPETINREQLEHEAQQAHAALRRQDREAEVKRTRRELELGRARYDLDRKRAALEELRHDRELLVVRAPRRGLVLHGEAEAAPPVAALDRGSRLKLFEPILTVAAPHRLKVVTDVPESSLLAARDGTAAEVTVQAAPDFEALGRLDVDHLATSKGPDGGNLYRAEIALEGDDARLRPGMQCRVIVVATVPQQARAGQQSGQRGSSSDGGSGSRP